MDKYQIFDGIRFYRESKSGYYRNSKIKDRIHRYVWKFYNGEIPEGYQIHHKDHDKSNNDISNLELLPTHDHCSLHSIEKATNNREWVLQNLRENATPKASEWHRSEEGRKWHEVHYNETKDSLYKKVSMTCSMCGKDFIGHPRSGNNFCSNKCRSAYRRKIGVDNETRVCPVCGKEFLANKYSDTKCCSLSCARRYQMMKQKGLPTLCLTGVHH